MDAFVVVDNSLEKQRAKVIQKYSVLIDKVVLKIKQFTRWNFRKRWIIKNRLERLKNKFKNKFDIYTVLNKIEEEI